jgi:hypothetical protein
MNPSPIHHPTKTELKKYFDQLEKFLTLASTDTKLYKEIVNAPFHDKFMTTRLGLGIVVLLLVDKKHKTINRIALSDTDPAKGAVQMSAKRFEEIRIPCNDVQNIIAKAIRTGKFQKTDDWQYLFTPELTPEQSRFNQAGAGIDGSVVYPLQARDGGAIIFSYYQLLSKLNTAPYKFMEAYSLLVSQALELSTKN